MQNLENIIETGASLIGFGAGGGVGFFAMKWFFEFVGGRLDRRTDALDEGTQRLIKGLQDRLESVEARLGRAEEDLRECREQHAVARAEQLRLEAVLQGKGEIADRAQAYIAAERFGARYVDLEDNRSAAPSRAKPVSET